VMRGLPGDSESGENPIMPNTYKAPARQDKKGLISDSQSKKNP